MKLEIVLYYFCDSELLNLNMFCICFYFKYCDFFLLWVLKEREYFFLRICINNCWKVVVNDVIV